MKDCYRISLTPGKIIHSTDLSTHLSHPKSRGTEYFKALPDELQTAITERAANLRIQEAQARGEVCLEKAHELKKERHIIEAMYRFLEGKLYQVEYFGTTVLSSSGFKRPFHQAQY